MRTDHCDAQGVDVENYPGFERSTGSAIVTDMRLQVQAFDTQIIDAKVTSIDLSQRPFQVQVVSSGPSTSMSSSVSSPSLSVSVDNSVFPILACPQVPVR